MDKQTLDVLTMYNLKIPVWEFHIDDATAAPGSAIECCRMCYQRASMTFWLIFKTQKHKEKKQVIFIKGLTVHEYIKDNFKCFLAQHVKFTFCQQATSQKYYFESPQPKRDSRWSKEGLFDWSKARKLRVAHAQIL